MELGKEVLYLSQEDVIATGVDMATTVDLLEEVFKEKGLGRYQMPAKIGLYPDDSSYLHAMPCHLKQRNIMGLKWVTGFNYNRRDYGLPMIMGLFIYNDPHTGAPLAIMDSAWITAQRTGASCGMSLRVLGNPDNEVALLLGCGVQGHTSLEAIAVADKNLKKAYVYDILPEAAQRLAENLSKKLELDIIPVTDPRPVVPEADVFVTAGPYDVSKDISFITADMVKPSATITTVDFDIFFAQGFIDKAVGKYYTDDIHQYEHFLPSIRPMHSVPVELGDAMVGKYPLREKHDEICFAMNIGMAMDDLILAQEIYRRAIQQKIRRILPL